VGGTHWNAASRWSLRVRVLGSVGVVPDPESSAVSELVAWLGAAFGVGMVILFGISGVACAVRRASDETDEVS
jgi:hypothetical protein